MAEIHFTNLLIVVAVAFGANRVVSKASAAGLIAAGLLSVVVFPALALVLLRRGQAPLVMPTPEVVR